MPARFDLVGHLYVAVTLALTVYGQLVLKWQISSAGQVPDEGIEKLLFLLRQLLNPWIISGFASAFLAALAWMAAMTRFDLNYAYPFMSLAFIIVMLFSVLFLGEAVTLPRAVGTLLVVSGLIVIARG